MEEREAYILNSSTMQMAASAAEQIRKQQASVIQTLKPLQDAIQPYHSMTETRMDTLVMMEVCFMFGKVLTYIWHQENKRSLLPSAY